MESIVRQVDAYRDGWQAASAANTFKTWELRLQAKLALDLWDLIGAAIQRRSFDARDDRGAARDAVLRDQHRLYAAWYEPTRQLVGRLRDAEARGEFYEQIGELEYLCYELESYLRFDVEATIQGLHDMDAGRGTPIEVVRDELRRRTRSAVRQ